MLSHDEIRSRFLAFFKNRGHVVIPSASLVTSDLPGKTNATLFNTAGMQPLIPYLLGEAHPDGTMLASAQKCVRTNDLDEVGDNTHLTFFEMLGNWSLGAYFKEEAIKWSYEFLTNTTEGLGLDPARLYITVFAGNDVVLRDDESAEIWKSIGIPEHRIYYFDSKDNWWTAGENSPAGPSSEMHYDMAGGLGDLSHEEFVKAGEEQKVMEIWNDVFMMYKQEDGKVVGELPQKNVDTGAGFERLTAVVQGKTNIFESTIFVPLMNIVAQCTEKEKSQRIISDHLRTSIFLIVDGVKPSNTGRGYILRRLLRRAMMYANGRTISDEHISEVVTFIADMYEDTYGNIKEQQESIKNIIGEEFSKFGKTLELGLKEFSAQGGSASGGENINPFKLFTSYGFPIELTEELAKEKGIKIDRVMFDEAMKSHQDTSRTGAEQKFKGGLAGTGEMETKYHTATHLLHQALREVLGNHVVQKGSNSTSERLRFDFAHNDKMTPEEIKKVEDLVNEKIQEDLEVTMEEVPIETARARGALGVFDSKYVDIVKVYQVGRGDEMFSLEICGGPHVERTGTMGHFKIQKEEASSAGVRRIKAVLE